MFAEIVRLINTRYGTVIPERLVDYAVYVEYINRDSGNRFVGYITQIPRKYTANSFDGYTRRKYAMVEFEDEWLSSHGLSRHSLVESIKEPPPEQQRARSSSSYEDVARIRFHNTATGYVYCHRSCSGWDPLSELCQTCNYSAQCEMDLEKSNKDLHSIRKVK